MEYPPVSADLELIQNPDPPQDHTTEANGHIQGETDLGRITRAMNGASSVDEIRSQT